MINASPQGLTEALDLPGLAENACTANEEILTKARARANFRKENAASLALGNTQAEALQAVENRLAHELQTSWDACRGEPGVPTNDPSRKRLIEQALAASPDYQATRIHCLDLQHQAEMLDEEYQAARRKHNQAMAAWWQAIFALAPNLDLGSMGEKLG